MTLLVSLSTPLQSLFFNLPQELITGDRPYFDIRNDAAVLGSIMRGNTPVWPRTFQRSRLRLAAAIWSICTSCWRSDPLYRPNIAEIIDALYEHSRQGRKGMDQTIEWIPDASCLCLICANRPPAGLFSQPKPVSRRFGAILSEKIHHGIPIQTSLTNSHLYLPRTTITPSSPDAEQWLPASPVHPRNLFTNDEPNTPYPQPPDNTNTGINSLDHSSTSFPIVEMNLFDGASPIPPLKPPQSRRPMSTPSTTWHETKRTALLDVFGSGQNDLYSQIYLGTFSGQNCLKDHESSSPPLSSEVQHDLKSAWPYEPTSGILRKTLFNTRRHSTAFDYSPGHRRSVTTLY